MIVNERKTKLTVESTAHEHENRTIPASMRKAPSLLSFSTDSCSTLGCGIVRSLMFKAP